MSSTRRSDLGVMSVAVRIRHRIFGTPIPSSLAQHERLMKIIALPVFASDAMSSVAYATEAILRILVLYSVTALQYQFPITLAICFLIVIVVISYQQTVFAYPSGGGSYIVASENLGETPGLIAGASLLVDYVLTVAVSVTAGVAAIVSAYPTLHNYLVPGIVMCIAIISIMNMRGLKESGAVFALPTYGFVFGVAAMIVAGFFKQSADWSGTPQVLAEPGVIGSEANFLFLFIILRAFAGGCTAMTGTEAVSNGVPAFRPPESRNAAITLRWMAIILITMFLGISYLAGHLPILNLLSESNSHSRTVLSQIAANVFGSTSYFFYYIQISTFLILILAANTSFADFPRLASIMARDGYLPRQFARQGDRLVFQNGIIILAVTACLLVWHYRGKVDSLLPLYAIGVFTSFTLSQSGMFIHWKRLKDKGWLRRALINGCGAIITGIVCIIIITTKFKEGAYIVVILLSILFVTFKGIKRHYVKSALQLALPRRYESHETVNTVLLLVPRIHQGILAAFEYARSIGLDCRAVHVNISADPRRLEVMRKDWDKFAKDIPLVILESPFRSLVGPILEYVDEALSEHPDHVITVIVPEYVPGKWWHSILHENAAFQLKLALSSRKNVVVTNVRYFLG